MKFLLLLAAAGLAVGLSWGTSAAALELDDFLVSHGCAIGPDSPAVGLEAGLGAGAIKAMLWEAGSSKDAVRTGDWVVLPSSRCVIEPPKVTSRIRMDDPEVKAATSDIEAYSELGDPGCFLEGPGLAARVEETRGWDAETANREYLLFLAENLGNGNLAFYKDTPLSTPAGIQVLTGACADVANIEDIRKSQELRDRYFDQLIRQDAAAVSCERDQAPSYGFMDLAGKLTKGKNTNAWLFAEMRFIAMGAGWYEGVSLTEKGRPRPPLCRYEDR